jgi:hydroxyacylglutathione hydrolase
VQELDEAFTLFTNGREGPITFSDLKRIAAILKEDVSDDLLRDMILEANHGAGVAKGVGKEEFGDIMRRAGVWR